MNLRPTVIGSGTPASAPVPPGEAPTPDAPLRPTVITSSGSGPAHPPAPAAAPVAPPSPPAVTRVHGTERKGLEVDIAALRRAHPQASDTALDQAVGILSGIVPQTVGPKAIESLGRGAQEGVARLVERVLHLVDQASARSTGRHLERLQELLGELAEVLRPAALSWRRRSLRQTLAEQRPELDSLRSQLQQAEAGLESQRERLQGMQLEREQAEDGLTAALVAIGELRPRLDDDRRRVALDRREAELLKSLALLQTHALQMQQLETDYGLLAHRLRDTVLHALPAWLSLASAAPDAPLNDTERFRLLDPLQTLIIGLSRPQG